MSPQQRCDSAGLSAQAKTFRRQVGTIPDLLGNESNPLGKFLKRAEIRTSIPVSGEFVMAALARQQRPCTPFPPILVTFAVLPLPVAIVVITAPTRTERCINLQHCVNNTKRVMDDDVVGATNSVANQFE